MRTQQTNSLPMNTESQADLPAGYRLTELGPLPEEWRVVRLGEVSEAIDKYVKQEAPAFWPKRKSRARV